MKGYDLWLIADTVAAAVMLAAVVLMPLAVLMAVAPTVHHVTVPCAVPAVIPVTGPEFIGSVVAGTEEESP